MSYLIEDCLRIIFNDLKEHSASLYSCILVNRFWCQVGVQILWKNPYDTFQRNSKLYNVIIHLLPTSSKQLLIDNNVTLPDFSNQPLFNFVSFSSRISSNFIYFM